MRPLLLASLLVCLVAALPLHAQHAGPVQQGPEQQDPEQAYLPRPAGPLPRYSFDRYGIEEGLPDNTVFDLIQDRHGYLWIGTEGGLVRYDGQTFELYRPKGAGASQLSIVTTVLEDSGGDIWAGGPAESGLSRYDPSSRTWTHYRHDAHDEATLSSNSVTRLEEAAEGRLLAFTEPIDEEGSLVCIDRVDASAGQVRRFRIDESAMVGGEGGCFQIAAPNDHELVYRDREERIWVRTDYGLLRYDVASDSLIHYRSPGLNRYSAGALQEIDALRRRVEPLAALTESGGEANRTATFRVEETTPVLLVGLGEINPRERFDYGWLEDAAGDTLWEMSYERSAWAGGEIRSRMVVARDTLEPGSYHLRFRTDMFHSYGEGWSQLAPDRPSWWGVQVLPVGAEGTLPPATRPLGQGRAPDRRVNAIYQTRSGMLLVGTQIGLYRLGEESGHFTRLSFSGEDGAALSAAHIWSISEDDLGRLWVGTRHSGVFRVDDMESLSARQYRLGGEPSNFYPLPPEVMNDLRNWVRQIEMESDGTIWLRQHLGVAHLDPQTGEVQLYEHKQDDPHTLGIGRVFRLLWGRQGTLWAATAGGLGRLNRTRSLFRHLDYAPEEGLSQSGRVAWALAEGPDGDLWIGTPDGLNRLDLETGRSTHYNAPESPGELPPLPGGFIRDVEFDQSGRMWLGLSNRQAADKAGLVAFDPSRGVTEHHVADLRDSARLADENVSAVLEDREKRLWVGTMGDGLNRLDPATGTFTRYPTRSIARTGTSDSLGGDHAHALYEDRQGTLWIATNGSLNRFHTDSESFTSYYDPARGLAHISTMHEDREGRLWLGSFQHGLVRFDRATGETERFGERRGLAHNLVASILEDEAGYLWLGTPKGLVRFDPDTESFRTFDRADGLPGGLHLSAARMRDGTMVFGGEGGLIAFDPANFRSEPDPPAVALEGITYRGARGDSTMPALGRALARLAHDENDVHFHYAGIDFTRPGAVRYRYRLHGLDEDWVSGGVQRSARYTSLRPGRYRFEVQAQSAGGIWSQSASVALAVLPPWWHTTWAYALYAMIFGAAVFGVDRFQRRRVIHKEREKARERESKLRTEAAEAWANYLQSENERQSQELEQARALQLSMLPAQLPEHPCVELAASMETATEVGGDYYDAHVGEEGTLTLAIGDATGHGAQAGTMVTAAKSLFANYIGEPDPALVLERSSQALRRVGMPKLYMAFALMKLRADELELAGAGMPPALVWRAGTGAVEAVPLKGIPLGGPCGVPYHSTRIELEPGDTVVLMSDGLPELRSPKGEELGYDRIAGLVRETGGRTAEDVVAHLMETAAAWSGGESYDDDVTVLVLRAR